MQYVNYIAGTKAKPWYQSEKYTDTDYWSYRLVYYQVWTHSYVNDHQTCPSESRWESSCMIEMQKQINMQFGEMKTKLNETWLEVKQWLPIATEKWWPCIRLR